MYVYDSDSRNSAGFQGTSGSLILLTFLSYEDQSVHIYQCC